MSLNKRTRDLNPRWTDTRPLIAQLIEDVIRDRPSDLILYLLDHLRHGRQTAQQVFRTNPTTMTQFSKDRYGLTNKRRSQVDAVYDKMTGVDGHVSTGSLKAFIGNSVKNVSIQDMLCGLDIDKDGVLSREDFYGAMGCLSKMSSDTEFQQTIDTLLT